MKKWLRKSLRNAFVKPRRKLLWRILRKAKASGNVLTQTMDDDGNLIGVKETVNFEERDVLMPNQLNYEMNLLMEQHKFQQILLKMLIKPIQMHYKLI